jgi:probable HAF family extracellular repeat protein
LPAIYDSRTGRITMLGSLGGVAFGWLNGVALSLNDRGQAVGYSYRDSVNRHAFLYSDGILTDLGSFGGYSAALAINNSGEIAGFASDTVNGYARAFVYREGMMTEINPFGGPNNES